MSPNLIVRSKTTIGTQIAVEMRQESLPTAKGSNGNFHTVYINNLQLFVTADQFRVQAFYLWLVSGSKPNDDPTSKSWVEIGYSQDTTRSSKEHENACRAVHLVKRFCEMELNYRDRRNALSLIEAHINWLRH